jgi:regulatory protein
MSVNGEALLKISEKVRRFCAYQERCVSEVRQKLKVWQLGKSKEDLIIDELIDEGYLDEERFVRTFVAGKFRFKSWGRIKIRYALREKRVHESLVEAAIKEIDEEAYLAALEKILQKKRTELAKTEKDKHQQTDSLARYAMGRGFEPELVWKAMKA